MRITDLLSFDRIVLDLRVKDKAQLLRELASRASAGTGIPASNIQVALLARETLGSTGLGNGFALPHARLEGIDQCFALLVRLTRPIDYAAIDGHPVDVLVLMLTPANADSEHMAALSLVARTLRHGDTIGRVRRAAGIDSIMGMRLDGR